MQRFPNVISVLVNQCIYTVSAGNGDWLNVFQLWEINLIYLMKFPCFQRKCLLSLTSLFHKLNNWEVRSKFSNHLSRVVQQMTRQSAFPSWRTVSEPRSDGKVIFLHLTGCQETLQSGLRRKHWSLGAIISLWTNVTSE